MRSAWCSWSEPCGERRGTAVAALALAAMTELASCQAPPPGTATAAKRVLAEEFVLVDRQGATRGRWSIDAAEDKGGPVGASLKFFAADQAVLCDLAVGPDSGGALTFASKAGQHFLLMGSNNGMQMLSGLAPARYVRLETASLSGGRVGQREMHHLELSDSDGRPVFNTADYFGFMPPDE